VTDAGILTDEERESIFCNIADVWVVNRKLLKDLDTRRLRTRAATSTGPAISIADIFIQRVATFYILIFQPGADRKQNNRGET